VGIQKYTCTKEVKSKKGEEGDGTMEKQGEEAPVVSFASRGRKNIKRNLKQ
jgi:hypothetical protein